MEIAVCEGRGGRNGWRWSIYVRGTAAAGTRHSCFCSISVHIPFINLPCLPFCQPTFSITQSHFLHIPTNQPLSCTYAFTHTQMEKRRKERKKCMDGCYSFGRGGGGGEDWMEVVGDDQWCWTWTKVHDVSSWCDFKLGCFLHIDDVERRSLFSQTGRHHPTQPGREYFIIPEQNKEVTPAAGQVDVPPNNTFLPSSLGNPWWCSAPWESEMDRSIIQVLLTWMKKDTKSN